MILKITVDFATKSLYLILILNCKVAMKSKDADKNSLVQRNPEAAAAWEKLGELFEDVLGHSGFGEIRVEVRWLSKGRKEIILASGKQYRFIVSNLQAPDAPEPHGKGGEA